MERYDAMLLMAYILKKHGSISISMKEIEELEKANFKKVYDFDNDAIVYKLIEQKDGIFKE